MRLDDEMNSGFINCASHFAVDPLYKKMDKNLQGLFLKILRTGYDAGFLDGMRYENKKAAEAS